MASEILRYEADGLSMESHLYVGNGTEPRPGVLVFPAAFGLDDHAKSRAERLAGLGYAALACDLHGGGAIHHEMDKALGLLAPMRENPEHSRARARGGLEALCARPEVDPGRVAAIGFCFGGTMALELARSGAPIAAAVGFHSGLATTRPDDAANIRGKVLVCLGADDPAIDAKQRIDFEEEMRRGKVDWQMTLYGGVVHSFTEVKAAQLGRPDFARYDERADARSWAEMRRLFDEVF